MSGVNKVILIGNLGKDPDLRNFEGGNVVANFTLATTEVYRDGENLFFLSPYDSFIDIPRYQLIVNGTGAQGGTDYEMSHSNPDSEKDMIVDDSLPF